MAGAATGRGGDLKSRLQATDKDALLQPACMMSATRLATALLLVTLLAGCEMLGIESTEKIAALKEGEGKAVGSACRQANRAIEDCFALNPRMQKAAVFGGWREMDEYMRENKLEAVAPVLDRAGAKAEPLARAAVESASDSPAGTSSERKTAPATGNKAVHAS
jgi:hypothetical protein